MSKKTERSAVSPLLIGGAVVISLVIAVVIGMNLEKGSNDSPGTDSSNPATADGTEDAVDEEQREWGESMALREADDPMALGDEDAPVVMIVYSDFTCPFCANWAQETQPELVERYVDSGELRRRLRGQSKAEGYPEEEPHQHRDSAYGGTGHDRVRSVSCGSAEGGMKT